MMIRHIFIAAMKEGVSEEIIREIAKKLRGLKGKYPTVFSPVSSSWRNDVVSFLNRRDARCQKFF